MKKLLEVIAVILLLLGIVSITKYFAYEKDNHVVKFNDGEKIVGKQTVKDKELVKEPERIFKDGYLFLGWYLDNSIYDFETPVTKNMNLVAKWQKVYDVVIHLEGNDHLVQVKENERIKVEDFMMPIHDDEIIEIYNTDGTVYDMNTIITENLELNAKYVTKK